MSERACVCVCFEELIDIVEKDKGREANKHKREKRQSLGSVQDPYLGASNEAKQ